MATGVCDLRENRVDFTHLTSHIHHTHTHRVDFTHLTSHTHTHNSQPHTGVPPLTHKRTTHTHTHTHTHLYHAYAFCANRHTVIINQIFTCTHRLVMTLLPWQQQSGRMCGHAHIGLIITWGAFAVG